jgi:4-diphosphocytidyl-2-C-methyl-D-erythritol kinase
MEGRSGTEEVAYAKINLALHVRGREPDGYHRIETLFAFAEDGDVLRVGPGDGLRLRIQGPFAGALGDDEDNLVLRAARTLAEACRVRDGAALLLEKRLPVAAGIGGGSADAAAALRALNRFWETGLGTAELAEIGRSLGADVPACVFSRTAVGTGRGDRLEPTEPPGLKGMPILLVNPAVALSTARVFESWTGGDGGALPDDWRDGRNDLEGPAMALAPTIGDLLDALRRQDGASAVRMSGSGATCFALFETDAERDHAAAAIKTANPGWWQLSSRIR